MVLWSWKKAKYIPDSECASVHSHLELWNAMNTVPLYSLALLELLFLVNTAIYPDMHMCIHA